MRWYSKSVYHTFSLIPKKKMKIVFLNFLEHDDKALRYNIIYKRGIFLGRGWPILVSDLCGNEGNDEVGPHFLLMCMHE